MNSPTSRSSGFFFPRRGSRHFGLGVALSLAIHLVLIIVLALLMIETPAGTPWGAINCVFRSDVSLDDEPGAFPQVVLSSAEVTTNAELTPVVADSGSDPVETNAVSGNGRGTAPGDGIGFFGKTLYANSFVFVLDKSGSMRGGRRMELAKREIIAALHALEPTQSFSLIAFDENVLRVDDAEPPALLPATPQNIREAIMWIQYDVVPRGGTKIAEPLFAAMAMHPEIVCIVSDGQVEEGVLERLQQEYDGGTWIHAVSVGRQQDTGVMEALAFATGGTHRMVDSDAVLAAHKNQPDSDAVAEAKLQFAYRYLRSGRPWTAQRRFEKIVENHPGTVQAQRAKQALKSM